MSFSPYRWAREFLYGNPGRAVPWLTVALGVGAALGTRSLGVGVATVVAGGLAWDRLSPKLVIEDPRLGPVLLRCPPRGPAGGKQLWLTFDDGPGPDTDKVLDILAAHQARATFFFIGENLRRYPDPDGLRQRLLAAGHRVGNHSWSHRSFLGLDAQATEREIVSTQRFFEQVLPESTLPIFRPPFGYRTEALFTVANSAKLSVVGWSVNSLDFLSGCPSEVIERVIERGEAGSVVLFHDGPQRRERTVEALPEILSRLKARRYEFAVPSPELLE